MQPLINETDLTTLLTDCHRRTAAAQRRLYHHYYPFALNIALHYADDEAGAEDIVQDGFIKLFRHLETEVFRGNFEKFFRRVIVNMGIDHYRARRTRSRFTSAFRRGGGVHTENNGPEELETQDVRRFLRQLSLRYRLVFNLAVMEGLPHAEIAQRLGISEGTSKSNLFKARKQLRTLAADYFQL